MEYKNYFKWLENTYRIEINQELRNVIINHFGDNLNIYTEQDMYEQSRKLIQSYTDRYLKTTFSNYKDC